MPTRATRGERRIHVAKKSPDKIEPNLFQSKITHLGLNINRYIDSTIGGIGEKLCHEVNLNTEHSREENMNTLQQNWTYMGSFSYHLFNCCLEPACPLCDAPVEDPKHYFLYYPSFSSLRERLFAFAAPLLGNRWHRACDKIKIDWFLHGISHDDFGTNVKLFQHVQSFIFLSNRFC